MYILEKLIDFIFRILLLCFIIAVFLKYNSMTLLSDTVPELIADRPDATESATVVPMKSLQIESGFAYENILRSFSQDLIFITFNTTLLRYGISNSFELRLGFEYLGNYNKARMS